jgi:hypothetical protein
MFDVSYFACYACSCAAGGVGIAQRAAGAIIGCCVGDAAATPVQWIYDVEKLQQLLEQRQKVTIRPGLLGWSVGA